MKDKGLIIFTLVLFIIFNTSYFWETQYGFLAFPLFLLLILFWLFLFIFLIVRFMQILTAEPIDKPKMRSFGLLVMLNILLFWKPSGFIDFEKFYGEDVFIARREGVANCATTLKLKNNKRFRERDVCFGVSITEGIYVIKHDTVFFYFNVEKDNFYRFGVLEKDTLKNYKSIRLYRSNTDTFPLELQVVKSDL